MKKILIVVSVIAMTIGVQAASFDWSCTGGASNGRIYGDTSGNTLYALAGAVTAYLFDANTVSQDALLAGLRSGGAITSFSAVDSTQINSSSKIASKTADYASAIAGNDYTFYFAIVNGDNVYISQEVVGAAPETGSTPLSFASGTATASAIFNDSDAMYGGAGWYGTAAVPEPTSGLLMLLGVAGLALRRRRA